MINHGELYSNYQEAEITEIIADATEQFVPDELGAIAFPETLSVFKDGVLQRLNVDYTIIISQGGKDILNFRSTV